MILELVLKDFRASWKYMMAGAAAAFALCVMALTMMLDDGGHVAVGVYLFVVVASCKFLALLCIKVDHVFNADEIYASLPVSRSAIVGARYVTSILLVVIGLAVAVAAIYPAEYWQHPVAEDLFRPGLWKMVFATLLVLITVTFPFYFRFGLGRGMVAILVVQFTILGLGYVGYHLDPLAPFIHRWTGRAGAYLSSQSDLWLVVVGLALLVPALAGSVWLSCRAYRRVDL